jgi:hypothetical protein
MLSLTGGGSFMLDTCLPLTPALSFSSRVFVEPARERER